MVSLVPVFIIFDGAKPKGSAEVDHFSSSVQQAGGQFERHFGRSRKEDDGEPSVLDCVRRSRDPPGSMEVTNRVSFLAITAVFEQNGIDMRMFFEDANQFGTGVAAETD